MCAEIALHSVSDGTPSECRLGSGPISFTIKALFPWANGKDFKGDYRRIVLSTSEQKGTVS